MELTEWQIATGVLGLIVLIRLFLAPYWKYSAMKEKRDEAHLALNNLTQTPLKVEFSGYERSLIGKNWRLEDQYMWSFFVTLTNKSDKNNVGTKAVSLLVNFNTSDEKTRSLILHLVPETERDVYSPPSNSRGRVLMENEYLQPFEPITGFYQFLEEGLVNFGINMLNINQTWPTLIVVDSFDGIHRREFKRRPAKQSSSDKEDSSPQ